MLSNGFVYVGEIQELLSKKLALKKATDSASVVIYGFLLLAEFVELTTMVRRRQQPLVVLFLYMLVMSLQLKMEDCILVTKRIRIRLR